MKETRDGWRVIEQSYQAPKEARNAKLELHYRWDGDGAVHFGETSFEKNHKTSTAHGSPRNGSPPSEKQQIP